MDEGVDLENYTKNNLLDDFVTTLCVKYPIELSEQFLGEIKSIPLRAFESNGPGVVFKLLLIATVLIDSINLSNDVSGYESLQRMFDLISKLKKTDMIIPRREYDRIKEALTKMEIDIFFSSAQLGGYISKWNQMAHWTPFLLIRLYFIQEAMIILLPVTYQIIKNKKIKKGFTNKRRLYDVT